MNRLLGSLALSALSLYILLGRTKAGCNEKGRRFTGATNSLSGPAIKPIGIGIWIRDSS
jgi:hypothetical protein